MKVRCDECLGDGVIAVECSDCAGVGEVNKKECPCCDGSGEEETTCPDCDGTGEADVPIQDFKLTRDTEHYAELLPLQEDAIRARKQADQLSTLRPERAESYQAQLSATLAEINRQAEEIVNPKKPRR